MFEFDGSFGEGGGDVLRFALGYSSISGLPVKVNNIRSKRKYPGLQLHHLSTVKILGELCDAELLGAEMGSHQLVFAPRNKIAGGKYIFDVYDTDYDTRSGTVAPVIKAAIIPLAFSQNDSYVVFRGSTESSFSVPLSRLQTVYLPTLKKMGIEASINIKQRSWYPLAGGEVEVFVKGGLSIGSLNGLIINTRGALINLTVEIIFGNKTGDSIQNIVNSAIGALDIQSAERPTMITYTNIIKSNSQDIGVLLFAQYEKAVVCFERFDAVANLKSTILNVFASFSKFHSSNATTDKYLSDQLVLPCILASGESSWITSPVTDHLLTNIWLAQNWAGARIELKGKKDEVGIFSCMKYNGMKNHSVNFLK